MIQGRIEHNKIFIENCSKDEMRALRKALKIYFKKFRPEPGEFPYTIEDIFDREDKAFPTPFLEKVRKKLEKKEIQLDLKDNRVFRKKTERIKLKKQFDHPPRNWQKEALDSILENTSGMISSPTATGKTRVIYETILALQVRTLIIVPTTSIQSQIYNSLVKLVGSANVSKKVLKQTEEEYLKEQQEKAESKRKLMEDLLEGKESGKFIHKVDNEALKEYWGIEDSPEEKYLKKKGHDKEKEIPKWKKKKLTTKKQKPAAITVACFQSLDEYSKSFLETIECVIIDEAHHASARTIREALMRMKNAAFRYGFSATPWRDKWADMQLLTAALGDNIIYEYDPEKAIEEEVVAVPELKIIHPPQPDEFLRNLKHWRTVLEKGIIGNRTRNNIIVKEASDLYFQKKNVFIAVDEIAHAEILKEKLEEAEVESILIHGQKRKKENEKNVEKVGQFDPDEVGIISIGTMAVGEGTDMPNIDVVILASGGKSSIRFLQRIGRGMRRPEGKDRLLVIDFQDWFNPILMRHSNERQKTWTEYFKKATGI